MFKRKPSPKSVPPYSRLAGIYDYVMRHVDYVHWADYIESLLARHGPSPARMLDLACGTGTLAIELRKREYGMEGADGCGDMLEIAKAKVQRSGYDIPLHHKNFLDLDGLGQFETVLCLYDSMNYLMSTELVSQALKKIRTLVKPDGFFIFDVCTESNSLRHFRDMTDQDQGEGFSYSRHSFFEDGVQFNKFEIHFEESQEVVHEVHQQRIYGLDVIEQLLEDSPFEVAGAYGGFDFSPPTEFSDRVHFVLRASQSES